MEAWQLALAVIGVIVSFLGVSGALAGWVIGRFDQVWKSINAIRDQYVRKDDFARHESRFENALSEIRGSLTRIEEKLDGKADKRAPK